MLPVKDRFCIWPAFGLGALALWAIGFSYWPILPEREGRPMGDKVIKSDEEWKRILTPEQYRVARKQGTEPAFTGEYWDCHADGMYTCACCGQPLFDSTSKFESGTGWPSFYAPVDEESVSTKIDRSHFMTRTEALCSRCDAHLGHVFNDGASADGTALLHELGGAQVEATRPRTQVVSLDSSHFTNYNRRMPIREIGGARDLQGPA